MDFFGNISSETKTWLIKWLIPTLIGISMSIVLRMQEAKSTWIGVVVTFTCGIGFSYLFWFAKNYVSSSFQPFVIAVVAMSGEKIGRWLMHRLSIEKLLNDMLGNILTYITKKK